MLFWVAKLKVNFVTESIQKAATFKQTADLYVKIIYYNQSALKKINK